MPPPPQQPQYPQNPQNPQYPHNPQYPYGQQPPQAPGPYGAPYPQQPYPAWGAPPMVQPPPKKRRAGMIVGIVGGGVGAVVAIVVALALIGAKAESGFPEAKMMLTLPRVLLDQKYKLVEDLSDSEGRKIEDEADGAWDAKVTDAVVGRYSPGGDETKGTLVVSGMYGRFKHPDLIRHNMLKGAGEADGVKIAGPAKDITPSGAGATVSCEVLVQKQSAVTLTYPVCAWADDNTAAAVAEIGRDAFTNKASDVDLDTAAANALKVRSEMIKAIG